MNNRFFVCDDGIIWTVYPNGETNFPHTIKIEEVGTLNPSTNKRRRYAQVLWLGATEEGSGSAIEGEYTLHISLTTLAAAIEGNKVITRNTAGFRTVFGSNPVVGERYTHGRTELEVLSVGDDFYNVREVCF